MDWFLTRQYSFFKKIVLSSEKIFIVEKEKSIAEKYRLHFLNLGYKNISIHTDQHEALKSLDEHPVIFFVNYALVIDNGFDLLKQINLYNPNVFVVTLCDRDDFSFALNSLKYGAFDCVKNGENDLDKITDVLNRIEIYKSRIDQEPKSFSKRISSLLFKSF